jgi:hypothetical protein
MSLKKYRRDKKSRFSNPANNFSKIRRLQRDNLHEITKMNLKEIINADDLNETDKILDVELVRLQKRKPKEQEELK